jgi:hypothetical protein
MLILDTMNHSIFCPKQNMNHSNILKLHKEDQGYSKKRHMSIFESSHFKCLCGQASKNLTSYSILFESSQSKPFVLWPANQILSFHSICFGGPSYIRPTFKAQPVWTICRWKKDQWQIPFTQFHFFPYEVKIFEFLHSPAFSITNWCKVCIFYRFTGKILIVYPFTSFNPSSIFW